MYRQVIRLIRLMEIIHWSTNIIVHPLENNISRDCEQKKKTIQIIFMKMPVKKPSMPG